MEQETVEMVDAMNPVERALKRIFDFFGAMFCLIVSSPVFLLVYIVIKCQKDGPVIYSQERIGLGGEPFTIYKFRTMSVDTEKDGIPKLTEPEMETSSAFCLFLRKHHLDELPQLWNVVKGDMSFVGPRPERKYFIDKIMEQDARYKYLYQVRPGLTSEATVYNGYTNTIAKMLKRLSMDLDYMQRRSLWSDLKIVFLTVYSVIEGKK
jgi:lipopolysaccharide/colanic/teichoic acid biosynthesis glycosyltransferase